MKSTRTLLTMMIALGSGLAFCTFGAAVTGCGKSSTLYFPMRVTQLPTMLPKNPTPDDTSGAYPLFLLVY